MSGIKETLETEPHFIAYFDILGYENMIKAGGEEKIKSLLSIIDESVKGAMVLAYTFNEIGTNIKMKVFSDNFFFCTKDDPYILVILISLIQTSLAMNDIFIRGALCYGNIYFDDHYVFGKGIIDAHFLESNIALFPRIILDNTIIKAISPEAGFEIISDYIYEDFDGNKYISYLNNKNDKEKMLNDSEMSFDDILSTHKKLIQKNLSSEDKSVLQKYQWCKRYHNKFCKKNDFNKFVIE